MVGRQPNAPAAFTPGEIPGTHFQRLSRPQGTWLRRGEPRKKSPVTPPGIDPGTVRLVAQCLNHYATPGPGRNWYPLQRRLGGPQGRSGRVRKILPKPGFDPRTEASRYSDWALPAHRSYITRQMRKGSHKTDVTWWREWLSVGRGQCNASSGGHCLGILRVQRSLRQTANVAERQNWTRPLQRSEYIQNYMQAYGDT